MTFAKLKSIRVQVTMVDEAEQAQDFTLDLDPATVQFNMNRDYDKVWGEPGTPDWGKITDFVLRSESFSIGGQTLLPKGPN